MVEVFETSINGARVEIAETHEALSEHLRDVFVGKVAIKPNLVALVPTGGSPITWYALLARHAEQNPDAFSRVTFCNLDEFCTIDGDKCEWIPRDHPQSYRRYMAAITESLGITRSYFPGPDNFANPGTYDAQIEQLGGIDLAVLGLGPDHACGFNYAGSPIDSVTRHVNVSDLTRKVNAEITKADSADDVPPDAITAGIATALKSRSIVTIASGTNKSKPVFDALHDPVGPTNPATYFRGHPEHTFLIDAAAAYFLNV